MIFFSIRGNQEDPEHGNPLGYTRTTQRAKHVNPQVRRYNAWKDYVWASLKKAYPDPPRFGNGKIVLNCYIEFAQGRRPDPGNVVKGIADALSDRKLNGSRGGLVEQRLYRNDRNVMERCMDYAYSENPGVLVVLSEL